MKTQCLNQLESSILHNHNSKIEKLDKAITMLKKDNPSFVMQDMLNTIMYSKPKESQTQEPLSKILLENKFLSLTWEILFDESSSITNNIAQIKIQIKITFINLTTFDKETLTLLMNEKQFNELLVEITKIQKHF